MGAASCTHPSIRPSICAYACVSTGRTHTHKAEKTVTSIRETALSAHVHLARAWRSGGGNLGPYGQRPLTLQRPRALCSPLTGQVGICDLTKDTQWFTTAVGSESAAPVSGPSASSPNPHRFLPEGPTGALAFRAYSDESGRIIMSRRQPHPLGLRSSSASYVLPRPCLQSFRMGPGRLRDMAVVVIKQLWRLRTWT